MVLRFKRKHLYFNGSDNDNDDSILLIKENFLIFI